MFLSQPAAFMCFEDIPIFRIFVFIFLFCTCFLARNIPGGNDVIFNN